MVGRTSGCKRRFAPRGFGEMGFWGFGLTARLTAHGAVEGHSDPWCGLSVSCEFPPFAVPKAPNPQSPKTPIGGAFAPPM